MEHEQYKITRVEFEMNLFEKLDDLRFLEDMSPLLTSTTVWDAKSVGIYVLEVLAPLMPGDAWQKAKEKLAVYKAK